ncbi:unnamed protein product [Acanthoscelides obtectus]|uniref:Ubiquitin-like domain-containing protein n=1 Tax=Acanthoscelides obtectus TaxID=200917 RepID=A0A9P0LFD5_ACAOB|nr:unnamed protein product [Acanthoscelides obtectus]CAK1679913.1 Transmembrane and ubiquitin-like domain-containing protein 2 [Acanthoscelides obtectus]
MKIVNKVRLLEFKSYVLKTVFEKPKAGTSSLPPVQEEPSSSTSHAPTEGAQPVEVKPPEEESQLPEAEEGDPEIEEILEGVGEEQSIIDTMDADANELRQRRLAFYNVLGNRNEEPTTSSASQSQEPSAPPEEKVHSGTDNRNTGSSTYSTNNGENHTGGITIKLKYINDDLKLVDGRLDEMLGEFKRRHFQPELSQNKLVRLIFNGQVLQPDTQTLKSCGLFHNCVVHCLVHQKKQQQTQGETSGGSRAEGYSFQNTGGLPHMNNNNQNRDWDLGNFLFAFISFILLAAWYFRYVYAHLYTLTATVGLILITGIFTIMLVGFYFPEDENIPNPTIRIARERLPTQTTTSATAQQQ